MSTSMSRRKRALCVLTALLLVIAPGMPVAQGDVIVNVVDGRLIFGDYNLELADGATPIEMGTIDGNTVLHVRTTSGLVTINLGDTKVSLTQQAAARTRSMGNTSSGSGTSDGTGTAGDDGICPICGRSLAIGNHTRLVCGHYGCEVPADHVRLCEDCGHYRCNGQDHTKCEHCGVRWCVHVDYECEYSRNPVPTPTPTPSPSPSSSTTSAPTPTPDPNATHSYYHVEDDGTAVYGAPELQALTEDELAMMNLLKLDEETVRNMRRMATAEPGSWNPGRAWEKAHATPIPMIPDGLGGFFPDLDGSYAAQLRE